MAVPGIPAGSMRATKVAALAKEASPKKPPKKPSPSPADAGLISQAEFESLPSTAPPDPKPPGDLVLMPLDYEPAGVPVDPNLAAAFGADAIKPDFPNEMRWSAIAHLDLRPDESAADYISRLRDELYGPTEPSPPARRAVAMVAHATEQDIASWLRDGLIPGDAEKTEVYLGYLRAHGVDQRTLDDIASGALPMDRESRMARAREMGLDPDAVWFRWDDPLKSEMRGYTGAALSKKEYGRVKRGTGGFIPLPDSKEGLVYTHWNPSLGRLGDQHAGGTSVLYPLLGPRDGIAGIDAMYPEAGVDFSLARQAAMNRPVSQKMLPSQEKRMRIGRNQSLPAPLASTRQESLEALRKVPAERFGQPGDGPVASAPDFDMAENRKLYTEPLMSTGAKGLLVRDETGVSTAFTPAGARQLRRADIAPMDTRFRNARNLLQALLPPVVAAGGYGMSESGAPRRTEERGL
jgi:hypothetical protein